jgi:hypothetical protein
MFNATTTARMGHVSRFRDPHQELIFWLLSNSWSMGWRVSTEDSSVEASGDRGYLANVHGFECEVIVTIAPLDKDGIVIGVDPYPEILLNAG